jgi:putative endonuclease
MNPTEDTPPPSAPPPGADRASRTRTLGAFGEAYAARHLVDRGMVLLDRNWRCELGEIDLVLRDGDTLVFCEVKTRSSALYGAPLESVTARKAARLRRLAARWLADHQVRPRDVRLDLVGVLVPRTGGPSVEHAAGVG